MLTETDAVKIAKEKVIQEEGPAALNGRRERVRRDGANWHVSFPFADRNMLGGEAHVVIADDGTIVRFYSTQ